MNKNKDKDKRSMTKNSRPNRFSMAGMIYDVSRRYCRGELCAKEFGAILHDLSR